MTALERTQKVAFWVAVISALLGFMTSAGCRTLPEIDPSWVGVLHVFLVALGAICGYLAVGRGEEIDRQRWRIAEDPGLTSGERDYAHRYAERERRWAATSFLAVPLMLGYWLAYQVEGEGQLLVAQVLPVTALLGAICGWIGGRFIGPGKNRSVPPWV